ncbi:thioredoxin family protein [Roseospira marina]|uniref:Thioredoxin family protein n=1 Tax=Roseospira marina TaxID=140057 RepID=A0A5M6IG74_9PROT|nr:thioredoxin family protein [Roseospira marina]KAA5607316.1 thioredoxin family protein [Roseospira marina]MBB4312524.1 peroxiredoxin [Roseospira marina]MBB5085460.1 peroxiredoxin [Roseospira marina]
MAVHTPICDFGWPAPDFALPGVDGKTWRLADVRGARGTLIVFICNHCPYVKAVVDRLVRDAHALTEIGIGVAAICSNDPVQYPDDSFENMKRFAVEHGFQFPYLHDETQAVAHAYDAVCTPDFFGFDGNLGLQYRGRLDSSGRQPAAPDARRELFEAMQAVAAGGSGPTDQTPSMGCSIKWKAV